MSSIWDLDVHDPGNKSTWHSRSHSSNSNEISMSKQMLQHNQNGHHQKRKGNWQLYFLGWVFIIFVHDKNNIFQQFACTFLQEYCSKFDKTLGKTCPSEIWASFQVCVTGKILGFLWRCWCDKHQSPQWLYMVTSKGSEQSPETPLRP